MFQFVLGDATKPCVSTGTRIILHVCNDKGYWGAGFVLALSGKWKDPENVYRKAAKEGPLKLGDIQPVQVEEFLFVVNIIGQHDIIRKPNLSIPPIRYQAIDVGLEKVCEFAKKITNDGPITFHMPRIGCGLAGGTWERMEPIIKDRLKDFDCYVYDFK